MNRPRISYEEMGHLIFSSCQAYCRHKIHSKKGWLPSDEEHEISYAYEQLDSIFQLPIEQLMLEVLVLILDAGRGSSKFLSFHKEMALKLLSTPTIDSQIDGLPAEERELLLNDMKILDL